MLLRGFDHTPIRGVRLVDCSFDRVREGNVVEHDEEIALENVQIDGRTVREL